jgi:hypothetical protein
MDDASDEPASEPRPNGHDPLLELWIDDDDWAEIDLPKRPWVAYGHALRRAVTILAGPPSALKSSLMLAWACALALGQEHGRFRPIEPGCCVLYNVEDDQTEQRRRLSAVLRQFNAAPADIHGKIIRVGPSGVGTLFIRDSQTGAISSSPAMDCLRAVLRERLPAMLIVDPLAELHGADENDNTALRAVIAEFRKLAVEFNMAVVAVHHTRKGAVLPGDPDAARGASSIIGAGRVVLTLAPMCEDDADQLGLPRDRASRSRYVRLDDAKQNYAGIGDAQWYEKALYTLDNGEMIATAVPWQPPDMWKALPATLANRILDEIDAGIDGGKQRYTDAPAASDRAAWKVVQKHVPSYTEKQARAVIKTWGQNSVLTARDYNDDVVRKKRSGLHVQNAKRPG